ncbi:MAG: choice-of-anchor D domain-containing protein, partial [bacterium]
TGGGTGTLGPNATRDITLRFAPTSVGNKLAYFVLNSSAASTQDTVTLSGMGIISALALSSRSVSFGNVWAGSTADQTITLTNAGSRDLRIMSTSLFGANTGDFLIITGGAMTLPPSISRDISLRFAPQSGGIKTAALIIASDVTSPPDTVILFGDGSAVSVEVSDSGHPPVGTTVNLEMTLPPAFQPTSQLLFYREAGKTRYDSTQILQNTTGFQADVPADMVTLRGVEFYVRLADGSTVVTFPTVNARNRPQVIRVRVGAHPSLLPFAPNTYRMISVPVDLDSVDFAHVLEEFANYDTLRWRLFRWENGAYAEHRNISAAFTPGTAFWLVTRGGERFGINNGLSTDSAQPFTVTLQPGWNQIANPFAFPVAWNSVRTSGAVDTLAFWNGIEYQYNVTILEPWEGYFLFNSENTPITLTIPPIEANPGTNKISAARQLAGNEYLLQFSAQLTGTKLVDTQNFVGLLNQAQAGRDALDFAEAPAIGDYIQMSILEKGERFAGNFKPLHGEGQQWDVELRAQIRANVAKKLQISVQEMGRLPDGWQLYILDRDYGAILPVSSNAFRIELNETFPVRHLKIIAGTKAYAESNNEGISLVPLDYVLEQNYPNPFALGAKSAAENLQTTIRYQLSRRTPVVLEIRNLLGQKVQTLVDDVQSTGQHAAVWNGLDAVGRQAASGVYFYTLKTDEFTATRKLILTR